jgi:hypothetical protein
VGTHDAIPLLAGGAGMVPRTPGVRDLLRLFPDPSSVGRGSIGVEGGLTVVAGRGMGRTTLLRQLLPALERERGLPVALVAMPDPTDEGGEEGFHRWLACLVEQARTGLLGSALLASPELAPLRAVLEEPAADEIAGGRGVTPRGLERWVKRLGAASGRTGGVCLLVDDVDGAAAMPWKIAFMAALRFAFQAAARVTPIYASWRLFLDETAPGSHYFRNVTRPVFLAPLAAAPAAPGDVSERDALAALALPGLAPAARDRVFALAGGHPQLLERVLADLRAAAPGDAPRLDAAGVDALLAGAPAEEERALAARLIAGSPELAAALRELARAEDYPFRNLSKVMIASGLVDRDAAERAQVPELVRAVL